MKTTWPGRSRGHSDGCGSLTLTTRSARAQISAALVDDRRAGRGVLGVGDPAPLPRPASIRTVCPAAVSSSAPTGQHRHAVLVGLDLPGHPDDHRFRSPRQGRPDRGRRRLQAAVPLAFNIRSDRGS